MRRTAALAASLLLGLAAGCGGKDDEASTPSTSPTTSGSDQADRTSGGGGNGSTGSPARGPKGSPADEEGGEPDAGKPGPDVGKPGPADDGRDPERPQGSPITKSAPDFVGLFTREVAGADVSGAYAPAGRFNLVLGVDSFLLSSKRRGFGGRLSQSDGRLTLRSDEGKKAKGDSCAGTTGTYRYSVEDQVLTLTPVTDSCVARRKVLDSEWTQKQ